MRNSYINNTLSGENIWIETFAETQEKTGEHQLFILNMSKGAWITFFGKFHKNIVDPRKNIAAIFSPLV